MTNLVAWCSLDWCPPTHPWCSWQWLGSFSHSTVCDAGLPSGPWTATFPLCFFAAASMTSRNCTAIWHLSMAFSRLWCGLSCPCKCNPKLGPGHLFSLGTGKRCFNFSGCWEWALFIHQELGFTLFSLSPSVSPPVTINSTDYPMYSYSGTWL